MTAGMRVFLVVFLSTVVLHSVSAGGVYCAKTARARAAALGLDYPGVHGAPDLFGPAHYEMHLQPFNNSGPDLAEAQLNTAYYGPNQPVMGPSDNAMHYQAPPSRFEGNPPYHALYEQHYSTYATDHVLRLPGGQPVSNHASAFEEIKHVPPEAVGQSDLANGDPRNHNQPLPFVNSIQGPVVHDSAPNRHGVTHRGIPQPQRRNRNTYRRGPTGYSRGREGPVLGSFQFIKVQGTIRNRPGPAGSWRRPRFPSHIPQYVQKNLSVRPFARGSPVLRHLTQPRPGPVRKKW